MDYYGAARNNINKLKSGRINKPARKMMTGLYGQWQ